MKKILMTAAAAIVAAASFATSAHSTTFTPNGSGILIETARGGANGVELGEPGDNDFIDNSGVDFQVLGALGNAYADSFGFTMNKAFNITLDLFTARDQRGDASYKFFLNGDFGSAEQDITTPQTGLALFSNLAAGDYTFTILSPSDRAADYNLTVSAVPLPAALPLYGAGIAALGFFGWRSRRKAALAA